MRVLLRDLSPGQLYAVQFRSNDGAGNTSDWSQVNRFTTTNDTNPPGNVSPAGLTWYSTGTSYIAQWTPVTTNADGTTMHDLRDYHVAITNGQTTVDFYTVNTKYEFTQQQCIQQFGSFQTALTVSVTARDLTYNESPVPATLAVNPLNPPTPSTPSVSTYLGLLMVTWNSQTAGGASMSLACTNFDYCEVHVFSTPNQPIPADNSSMVGRMRANDSGSKFLVSNLTYGQTYYVKLVAVNVLGKKSGPSGESSGTPVAISGLDIQNGQIAAEQINWSSTKIPGGNAYYSTSQPTTPIGGGSFGTGDIWYDTDNGYAAYKYNGTTWVAATDVGFIAGQKIIAGTITADKVGTNFLIAAKAMIGHAWIDSADITAINAGIITAGVLKSSATATYGGVSQPAWSFDLNGNAVLNTAVVYGSVTLGKSSNTAAQNSAAAVMSYNYTPGTAGWAITGDGSVEFNNGTFRGRLVTGIGRHTEIVNGQKSVGDPTGSSRINFYSETGKLSNVNASTGPTTGAEYVELQAPIAGAPVDWNTIAICDAQVVDIRSGAVSFMVGPQSTHYNYPSGGYMAGGFDIFLTSNQGNSATNLFTVDSTILEAWVPSVDFNVSTGASNGFSLYFTNGAAGSALIVQDQNSSFGSPRLVIQNGPGYGASIGYWYQSGVTTQAVEIKDYNYSGFIPIRASAFTVSSDASVKTNVRSADTSVMLNDVMSMKVRNYYRLDGKGNPYPDEEVGFIAQEMPDQLIHGNPQGDTMRHVDLYQTITYLYGAFQEAVTEYRREINELKNRNDNNGSAN